MDTPLAKLKVTQTTLDGVAAHLWSHRGRTLKYFLFAAIVLWALVFLVRLGKPDGAPYSQRRSWYPRSVYVVTLLVAAVACGFALGKSPNPMEGAVKVFKAMVGLQPSAAIRRRRQCAIGGLRAQARVRPGSGTHPGAVGASGIDPTRYDRRVQAALFSLQGVTVSSTDGIVGCSSEDTMKNIGTLTTEGMIETDRTILRIMLAKKFSDVGGGHNSAASS